MTIYEKQRNAITQGEANALKREILNIIKYNSKQNVAELNKAVLELFKMDDEFKQKVYAMLDDS